ncbi:MAG TPA: LON peptidase substrate-binding domain-containing protein [Roseiflexaceae bacterium]|nr:LON peptidase substrate-binding domain-containing protein [Roseiflexaceae bacterium]
MTLKLPIFPLNTVLFPGASIRLHIFEERYRLMIGRCLEQSSPFGVALIRSGSEVSPDDPWVRRQLELGEATDELELGALKRELGGEAVPYPVGTTAQISVGESVRLSDGRYYLVAAGQRRFRIQYFVQRQPYLVASVAYLPEQSSSTVAEPAEALRRLYSRYWAALSAATGYDPPEETLPSNVVDLTYWMANRLRVENRQKQRWLEADVATRLREISAAIRAELALLPNAGPNERASGESETGSWN